MNCRLTNFLWSFPFDLFEPPCLVWEEVFNNGVKVNNETVIDVWKDWEGHRWNETIY